VRADVDFIVRPSALAVLRLMNSLNVVGGWKSGSQWTRRWREMDSNFQFRDK
jgi:hypothetical protein